MIILLQKMKKAYRALFHFLCCFKPLTLYILTQIRHKSAFFIQSSQLVSLPDIFVQNPKNKPKILSEGVAARK